MSAVLETVRRHCAVGMRFWDVAAATSQVDGLRIDIFPQLRPHARRRMSMNRSHVYYAFDLPGIASFEYSDESFDRVWLEPLRSFRVEVVDPLGRFLPIAFDADLPARDRFQWHAPWLSPPQSIALPSDTESPPALLLDRIPLFSAPQRPAPEPLAAVYAQLAHLGSDEPCAWALLQASVGDIRGLGLADDAGRVAVLFPYPAPPRPPLTSPPAPRDDFHWDVELTAFAHAPDSPAQSELSEFADLGVVLEQLDFPQRLVGALASPSIDLGPQHLEYRVPLTVRTANATTSRLYVTTI